MKKLRAALIATLVIILIVGFIVAVFIQTNPNLFNPTLVQSVTYTLAGAVIIVLVLFVAGLWYALFQAIYDK